MNLITNYDDETTDNNEIPVLPDDEYEDSEFDDEEITDDNGRIIEPWDDDFEYWKAEHERQQELSND